MGSFLPAPGDAGTGSGPVRARSLQGVAKTLLLPLLDRAREHLRPDGILHDRHALAVLSRLDGDPRCYGRGSVIHAVRAARFDEAVQAFLRRWPAGQVVELGAGLDTMVYRNDNGLMRWRSVDLAEPIRLRRQLCPDVPERYENHAASLTEPSWYRDLDPQRPCLVTAAGILMYVPESDVRGMIAELAAHFQTLRIIFDTVPPTALWRVSLRRKTGLPVTAYDIPKLHWSLTDPARLAQAQSRLRLARVSDHVRGHRRRVPLHAAIDTVPLVRQLFTRWIVTLETTDPRAPG